MATTLQEMIANRVQGSMMARLRQFYMDQGRSPAEAEALARAEMARRQPPQGEQGEPGFSGEQGRALEQAVLMANPKRLAEFAPAPQMDEFRETPVTPDEMSRYAAMRNRREQEARNENPTPWWDMPQYRNSPEAAKERASALQTAEQERLATIARLNRETGQSSGYTPPSQPSTLDRALEVVATRTTPAQAASPIKSEYGGGDYNDVFDVAYNPPAARAAAPARTTSTAMRSAPAPVRAAPAARQDQTNITATPVPRPQEQAAQPSQGQSWFSNLFKDPYEGKSARDLYALAQERGSDDPSNAALMARAMAQEAKEAGMARGGTASLAKEAGKGGGKDATIMKALEIIHHMIRTRG